MQSNERNNEKRRHRITNSISSIQLVFVGVFMVADVNDTVIIHGVNNHLSLFLGYIFFSQPKFGFPDKKGYMANSLEAISELQAGQQNHNENISFSLSRCAPKEKWFQSPSGNHYKLNDPKKCSSNAESQTEPFNNHEAKSDSMRWGMKELALDENVIHKQTPIYWPSTYKNLFALPKKSERYTVKFGCVEGQEHRVSEQGSAYKKHRRTKPICRTK